MRRETAAYSVQFSTRWGDRAFPAHYPPGSHIGNMYLAVHSPRYTLFRVGDAASRGIATTAMYGTTDWLEYEAQSAGAAVLEYHTAPVLCGAGSIEPFTTPILLNVAHSRVSFSAMLAPSPDLFVGAAHLALYDAARRRWLDALDVPLWAYRAGTDYGVGFYNEPDFPRVPASPIEYVTGEPLFDRQQTPRPLACLSLRRVSFL